METKQDFWQEYNRRLITFIDEEIRTQIPMVEGEVSDGDVGRYIDRRFEAARKKDEGFSAETKGKTSVSLSIISKWRERLDKASSESLRLPTLQQLGCAAGFPIRFSGEMMSLQLRGEDPWALTGDSSDHSVSQPLEVAQNLLESIDASSLNWSEALELQELLAEAQLRIVAHLRGQTQSSTPLTEDPLLTKFKQAIAAAGTDVDKAPSRKRFIVGYLTDPELDSFADDIIRWMNQLPALLNGKIQIADITDSDRQDVKMAIAELLVDDNEENGYHSVDSKTSPKR